MAYAVRFPRGALRALFRVMAVLAEQNTPVQVRMVGGEPTLGDEVLQEGWTEGRLGTSAGVVALVRRGHGLGVVPWGNADEGIQRAWNAVAWAVAKAGEDVCTGGAPRGNLRETGGGRLGGGAEGPCDT